MHASIVYYSDDCGQHMVDDMFIHTASYDKAHAVGHKRLYG
jgi:hypothetical protein